MLQIVKKPKGAQYQVSPFLLSRRFFKHGSLYACVDLDGSRSSFISESLHFADRDVSMIPFAVLRYVGDLGSIINRMDREALPGYRMEYDRIVPISRTVHDMRNQQCLQDVAPMDELFSVLTEIRLEDCAIEAARAHLPSIVEWRDQVQFAGSSATVIRVTSELFNADAIARIFDDCSSLQVLGTPDFMPCNKSSCGLLSLFKGFALPSKDRGISIPSFLIDEACARMKR